MSHQITGATGGEVTSHINKFNLLIVSTPVCPLGVGKGGGKNIL